MTVVGLVAEYNPFHNGHLYHLNQIKSELRPDAILCVMSGNFVQRGEPAIFDKWARAEMALKAGADLVIELPVCFSTATAEIFAESAVRLLHQTGVVDVISFGVENYYEKEFFTTARLLAKEPEPLKKMIKRNLKQGISFPRARQKSIEEYLLSKDSGLDPDALSEILKMPNSILALEYMKAIVKIDARFSIFPVLRKGSGYHDESLSGPYCSASALRKNLVSTKGENIEGLADFIPPFCLKIIQNEVSNGRGPVSLKDFEPILLYLARIIEKEELMSFFDMGEGLENRLKKAAKTSVDIEHLILQTKSKRYPETKIRRILIHILLNIKKDIVSARKPLYFRILGFTSKKGLKVLKQIKDRSSLPIITKASDYKDLEDNARKMFELDLLSSDIYVLAFKNQLLRKGGLDFKKKVISL